MKYSKFSHKTPHLKGKQHQLDPNLDLKQLVHHATVQYVDRDADGDVDVYDNPKKKTPDENPVDINVGAVSKKLIAKQKGEIKHTKRGMAYEGSLHKWFKSSSSKDGKPGWVNVVTGGTCASDEPGEGTPKCVSSAKRASMTDAERRSAARRKKEADPGQQQKSGAAKPTYVSTDSPRKMKEEKEEKRYCTKCKKRETRDECSYGPKVWDRYSIASIVPANEEKDHEYSMSRSELSTIMNAVKRLKKKMGKGEGNIEAWVQSKITKAADYLDSAADYIDSGEHDVDEECWSGYKQVGMKRKGKKIVPNCVPEETVGEEKDVKGKGSGKKDACYNKVKSRYDVWPSAYASGALVKCRKVGAANWGNKSESVSIEDANGNLYAEFVDIITPEPLKPTKGIGSELVGEAVRIPAKTGNIILVTLIWRAKYYMIKIFFPQVTKPNRKEVQDQIEKVYPGAKVQSYYISDIKPGEQFLQTEDWQKVNRQDKTDGLSQKAVNAYRKENPGSKLQTAVTEKNPEGKRAARRKSFCSRMSGMKKRLTSAETARDPDSRINKALRRWNCN